MDNGHNKRLKIEKKENLSTERSPPLPSSVNIFLFIINPVLLIYFSNKVMLIIFSKIRNKQHIRGI